MQIAICEDDEAQAGVLEELLAERLKEMKSYSDVDVYLGVDDIKSGLGKKRYDAYFLDIELGMDNGVELARYIKKSDINSIVVFTTSHTDYMADAFDVHAFNYIVKPVTHQKVDKIVTQLEEVINTRDDKLTFRYNRELINAYYDDIVYMESSKRIINLVTTNMDLNPGKNDPTQNRMHLIKKLIIGLKFFLQNSSVLP